VKTNINQGTTNMIEYFKTVGSYLKDSLCRFFLNEKWVCYFIDYMIALAIFIMGWWLVATFIMKRTAE
jgi:hypothetical protein